MKKICFILCLLLAFFQMCGCSAKTNDQNEQTQKIEPPYQLIFYSVNEYMELIATADLPDDELEEYLTTNSYNMNGIETRSDIQALEATVSSLPIPAADGLQITNMIIYPEWNQMYIRFVAADDTVVGTEIQFDPNSVSSRTDHISVASDEAIEAENMDLLVCVEHSEEDIHAYQADVDGYFLTFRFSNCTKASAEDMLKEMEFVSISEWE